MTRYRDLVEHARIQLAEAGIPDGEAAFDAELLMRHVLGWDRATWLTRRDEACAPAIAEQWAVLIARRRQRGPMAYILGVQEFYGRPFRVGPGVLIPRPESELIIDEALTRLATTPAPRVADIGTGSGCLAITLALECANASIVATDVSAIALDIAAANAAALGATDRLTFVHTNYLDGVPGEFDLVVANPPYVAESDAALLMPEVVGHEPPQALFGGHDGLRDVRAIAALATGALTPSGVLVMEIGQGQWPAVRTALAGAGLGDARARHDLQGIARVVVATRRAK